MNKTMLKTNFANSVSNVYSWQFNTIETPYQKHILGCCDLSERDSLESSLPLGRTVVTDSYRSSTNS